MRILQVNGHVANDTTGTIFFKGGASIDMPRKDFNEIMNTLFSKKEYITGNYKPTEISSRGEFAGYTELMSHVELRLYMQELAYRMNSKQAYESNSGGTGTSFPYSYCFGGCKPCFF